MAGVRRFTGLRLGAHAVTGLAGIGLGTGVGVITRRTILDRLDRALVRHRIVDSLEARPELVRARLGGTGANAIEARILAGQWIAVVTAATVGLAAELTAILDTADSVANPELGGVTVIVRATLDRTMFTVTFAATRHLQAE
jgi:hypothetical protein